jgi:hypothetical protein
MKGTSVIIFSVMTALICGSCKPSDVIYKEHVIYNFTSEGFLMHDVLQTIGKADVTRLDAGLEAGRSRCLEEAFYIAKKKALRVMFHTKLNIPGGGNTFDADYPVTFSEREYIRGNADFSPVLSKGYIALQDSRSSSNCLVVFRVMEKDLVKKIKKIDMSFCVNYRNYKVIENFSSRKNFCKENNPSNEKLSVDSVPKL